MSSDHPEDPDGPPDRRDDHDGEGTQASRPGGTPAETRSRPEYYTDLRIAVSAEQTAVTQRTSAKEQAAAEQWQEKSAESRWIWQEYQRKWPPTDRTPADRPGDQTSSRGTRADPWMLPPTPESSRSATGLPTENEIKFRQPYAPPKARTRTAT